MLGWIAWNSSPNIDEVGHLAPGVCHWHFGSFQLYSVNPPLVSTVATIPVVLSQPKTNWEHVSDAVGARPEWVVGHDFMAANGDQSLFFFRVARLMCIPFSLVGASVCIFWGRELCGNSGGMIAGILWCFSPNVLTGGQQLIPILERPPSQSWQLVECGSVWKGGTAGPPPSSEELFPIELGFDNAYLWEIRGGILNWTDESFEVRRLLESSNQVVYVYELVIGKLFQFSYSV